MSTLNNLFEKVQDKKSFYTFVKALEKDFLDNQQEWENITIDQFLEASIAWAEDSGFDLKNNIWKQFANFLYSGKFYE